MVETEPTQRQRVGQKTKLSSSRGLMMGLGLAAIFWLLVALGVFVAR